MANVLLSASACGLLSPSVSIGYGGSLASDWLQINVMLVLIIVMISSLLYALSALMPTQRREKLRGVVRYEIFEAIVSVVLIFIIMAMSSMSCYIGAGLSTSGTSSGYSGVFQGDELYVGNLVFSRGASLASQLYTTAIQYAIASQIVSYAASQIDAFFEALAQGAYAIPAVNTNSLINIYSTYSGVFSGLFAGITLAVFSALFIVFLMLPVVQAISLTVILPVAIFTRTLAFTGPKLREISNTFIALALGLFFVFPLTIAFNGYIANCMNLGVSNSGSSQCSWLNTQYLTITPPPIAVSSLFTSTTVSGVNLPFDFFNAISSAGAAPGLAGMFSLIFAAPTVTLSYANVVAEYAFTGIVLIAIDLLITVGFVAGIAKGLNVMSGIVGGGSFW
ncbi:MAG: hypothetical protein ACP5T3_00295 [Candidatus Micrarchaeia archaeon]